ncbi:hypothetical protein M3Y99_01044900 [Aphelenchoides fujianensis]|nr:hypothetical protein M3Y99_01044900 [Aphelenchoides fujianensis]
MEAELSTSMYCPSGMEQPQPAAQQMRFSSNSAINSDAGFGEMAAVCNKRRACSNGFPTQLLSTCGWTPTASTNITSSSGFGGSNTVGDLTNSYASSMSALAEQQQKPLSRSLESLALCAGPSGMLVDPLGFDYAPTAFFGDLPPGFQPPAKPNDDFRVDYSFDYDSGICNGSGHSTTTTTTATESFSSCGGAADGGEFVFSRTATTMSFELEGGDRRPPEEQQTPCANNNAYDEIIESMEQCRPFGQQQDFEMDDS